MSGAPPPYEAATGGLAPSINVTSAPSQPSTSTQHATGSHSHGAHHNEFEDDSSEDEMDNDGMLHPLQNDVEGRKSMDDEYRELPEGWVRCFDKNTKHHFYVDTKTERSTWLHPYDDPEYLQSLPDTHPANPNSEAARIARAKHEELTKAAQQKQAARTSSSSGGASSSRTSGGRQDVHAAAQAAMAGGHSKAEERSVGGKLKDKLLGSTKEERRRAKEQQKEQERKAAEQYLARRKALMEQRANDPRLQGYYSSPYSYAAPMTPYSRYNNIYGPRYGYRDPYYGRGYYGNTGYGYGPGMGMGGMGMGLGAGMLGGALLGGLLF